MSSDSLFDLLKKLIMEEFSSKELKTELEKLLGRKLSEEEDFRLEVTRHQRLLISHCDGHLVHPTESPMFPPFAPPDGSDDV